jgi:hypothetical protein
LGTIELLYSRCLQEISPEGDPFFFLEKRAGGRRALKQTIRFDFVIKVILYFAVIFLIGVMTPP